MQRQQGWKTHHSRIVPTTLSLVAGALVLGAGSAFGQSVLEKNSSRLDAGMDQIAEEYADYLENSVGPGLRPAPFVPSNPSAIVNGGNITVDIVSDNIEAVINALRSLGMTNIASMGNLISGSLPLSELANAAAIDGVKSVRPSLVIARTGSVTGQGPAALMSDDAFANWVIDGTGTQIGVLSDSYNNLGGEASGIASGDLPTGVFVLSDLAGGGSDEGRAMIELIHDVAPGAEQGFYSAFNGVADFALGIQALAGCPPGSSADCVPTSGFAANVIVDDVGILTTSYFQDSVIAQSVDLVTAAGVAYFSSAGNSAAQSYEADFVSSGTGGLAGGAYDLHDFDPGPGVDTEQQITLPVGQSVNISFQWDQPFFSVSGAPGTTNDLDIFISTPAGATPSSTIFAGGVDDNLLGGDAVEFFGFINDGSFGTNTFNLSIGRFLPVGGPAVGRIKYIFYNPNMVINDFPTNSSTIFGHSNAAGSFSMGAAFYQQTPDFGVNPPILEPFSSIGNTNILFDTAGNPNPETRLKPDYVAPDGTDTTFFGSDADGNGFPNFFGTSAAAPHAAAAAALLIECNPSLTPARLKQAFAGAAVDMNSAGFDAFSGFGLIDASGSADIVCSSADNIAVFRPTSTRFFLDYDGDGRYDGPLIDIFNRFGVPGDVPISGDWDGDGKDDIGVYRPSNSRFFLDINGNGRYDGAGVDDSLAFGAPGDLHVIGDWNGDGVDNIGVRRPANNRFFLDLNGNGTWDGASTDSSFVYGISGDLPIAGNWTGSNSQEQVGVYRPSNRRFYLDLNANGILESAPADVSARFGSPGDIPLTGDWMGSGLTGIGVFRPSSRRFFLDTNYNLVWNGPSVDTRYRLGITGDLPLIGNW